MKLLKRASNIFDRILNALTAIAGAILVFTVLLVTIDVILRYFLNRPIPWAIEITEYALVYITFLVAAWLLRKEGHVRIDLILNRLHPRAQVVVNLITSVFGIMVCAILTWYGADITLEYFQKGAFQPTILRIPTAFIIFIIPVGIFLLFVQFIRRTQGYLKSMIAKPDEK